MAEDSLLGFLALLETEVKDGYLCAILIIDSQGVPREFRATFPVKPTLVQKTLYGDALEAYIGVELCGKSLVKSISHTISMLGVNRESLLGIRKATDFPVLFLQRAGEALEVASASQAHTSRPTRQVTSKSGRFQPITLSPFRDSPHDIEVATPLVDQVFAGIDLFEPFDRIHRALRVLASQDQRFQ